MSKKDSITEQKAFNALIDVIGVEIEQAQGLSKRLSMFLSNVTTLSR